MEEYPGIRAGMRREVEFEVEERLTTARTGTPILSTPMMIGLMEKVCAEAVEPTLLPAQTTVGFEVCIKHKAAAPLGSRVRVSCSLTEVEGRKLLFEVAVTQGEKVIGEGRHRRTIVPLQPR